MLEGDVYFMETFYLEELAAARIEILLGAPPLKIVGATGSTLCPLALIA